MEEQVGSSTLALHVALTTSLVRVRGLVRAGIGEQEPEMQAALARVVALNEKLRAAEHDVSRTLQAQLGLSNNEMSVLWHLIAFAVEPQMKVLSAAATDESRPTVDAIRRCVYGEALTRDATRELGPRGMLRWLRLVEAQQPDAFTSVLTVSTRVLN